MPHESYAIVKRTAEILVRGPPDGWADRQIGNPDQMSAACGLGLMLGGCWDRVLELVLRRREPGARPLHTVPRVHSARYYPHASRSFILLSSGTGTNPLRR